MTKYVELPLRKAHHAAAYGDDHIAVQEVGARSAAEIQQLFYDQQPAPTEGLDSAVRGLH